MNHPLNKIIRTESKGYVPTNSEQVIRFDLSSNEILASSPSIFERVFNYNISYYVLNNKRSADGNIDIVWTNQKNEKLNLRFHYILKVDSDGVQKVIESLQDGISISDSFETHIRDFSEDFLEIFLSKGIDPIKDYYTLSGGSESIEDKFIKRLRHEIQNNIGFKVRSLNTKVIVDDDSQLNDYEIKKKGKQDKIEIRLKDFKDTLEANYEVVLGIASTADKINAYIKNHETHKYESIVEKSIKDFLLTRVTLEAVLNDFRHVKHLLKTYLNHQFKGFGREVKFFNIEIINSEKLVIPTIPLIDFSTSIPVIDLKSEKIIINTKLALKISNYSLFKESNIPNINNWIKDLLKNILEKDVITFNKFKTLLLDNITQKSFEKQINDQLSKTLERFGLSVVNLACRILNIVKLPKENEPLHHEVACKVKGSNDLIVFGNTISISLTDKGEFIKKMPIEYYSKSEDYFREWLKSELSIIVKRVIEFKDFRSIVLESSENLNIDDEIVIVNKKLPNYKILIKKAIENRAQKIGCEISQLLIEPDLTPLSWLEETTINFEEEYQTAQDGVSLKFHTTLSYKIDSLEMLAPELIKPDVNINSKVEKLIQKTIRKKLLTTTSERAYVEFYESIIDGEFSVELELKVMIEKELKAKFNASLLFLNFKPISTPFLDNYKKLRNIDGVFNVVILNNGIEVPIHGNFEVVGVSDWNRYKSKWTDADKMIERIQLAINDSLSKRLKNANLSDLLMENSQVQKHLESNVNLYLKKVISERYGLIINVFDLDRGQTLIDQQKLEVTNEAIKDKSKMDLESKKFLLGESQDKVRALFKEKKELEKKVKFKLASEVDEKRLKQINKEIHKLNQDQDLSLLGPGKSNNNDSNSIDSIFGIDSNKQKKLD